MVIRMINPAAVLLPAVHRLFAAALERGCVDQEAMIINAAQHCRDANYAIFIGIEDGEPKGLFSVKLPHDPKLDRPVFDLAANMGSNALAEEVFQAAVDFTRAAGYDRAWSYNQSGHSDAVYIRNARRRGIAAKTWASVIELDLTKREPSNGRQCTKFERQSEFERPAELQLEPG